MRLNITTLLFLFISWSLSAQNQWDSLSVIATKWGDSFVEWEIFADVEEEDNAGTLDMRWIGQNDWTAWDFRIGDRVGEITTQWREKFDEWQLHSEGKTVMMRTRWPRDYSEWRISDGENTYILSVVNPGIPEEWELKYHDDKTFQVYTEFEGDLRSWLIYQSGEKLEPSTQMAMIFAVLISTVPKI
ncbi:MAG: hypothetical protein R3275_00305 [Saprospiraceae bacterium]|nr:hypothetical protein [Saprospiraceae bacterium]